MKLDNFRPKDHVEDIQKSDWRILPVKGIQFTVEPDSSFEKLLLDLNVELTKFEKYSKRKEFTEKVPDSVIKINSLTKEIVNWVGRVCARETILIAARRTIELSVAIMEMYNDNPNIEQEFKKEILTELEALCSDLFDSKFTVEINEHFWNDLKYYEWLKKEGYLKSNSTSVYGKALEKQYFSDEELEKYFNENRKAIIQRMLNENRIQSLIMPSSCYFSIKNPIYEGDNNIGFSAYKTLQKALSFIAQQNSFPAPNDPA